MKITRLKNHLVVILSDGTVFTDNNCTEELYKNIILNSDNENYLREILSPKYFEALREVETKTNLLSDYNNSNYLSVSGTSIYLKDISELTLPEDFASRFYQAEKENNQELVNSYLNFWTLCSLNPDSRARTNLFWFLNKYEMSISKAGLFVAYRNVNLKKDGGIITEDLAKFITKSYNKVRLKKKSPKKYYIGVHTRKQKYILFKDSSDRFKTAEIIPIDLNSNRCLKYGNLKEMYLQLSNSKVAPVYTDSYTGTFDIKIGEIVKISRKECDPVQENTCSKGLHLASKSWLNDKGAGFGQVPIKVLVSPSDVVAVPPKDSYGKMRVCAYYPIEILDRDEDGNIIDEKSEDGFEDDFMNKINYTGEVNNEDSSNFNIEIPSIPEINREKIIERLDKLKINKYIN